jgi:hypothetical protein
MRFYVSPPVIRFRSQITPCVELAALQLTPCVEVSPMHPACAAFIAASAPYAKGGK